MITRPMRPAIQLLLEVTNLLYSGNLTEDQLKWPTRSL